MAKKKTGLNATERIAELQTKLTSLQDENTALASSNRHTLEELAEIREIVAVITSLYLEKRDGMSHQDKVDAFIQAFQNANLDLKRLRLAVEIFRKGRAIENQKVFNEFFRTEQAKEIKEAQTMKE